MYGTIVNIGGVEVEIRIWMRNGYFWGRNVKTREMKQYSFQVLQESNQVKQMTMSRVRAMQTKDTLASHLTRLKL